MSFRSILPYHCGDKFRFVRPLSRTLYKSLAYKNVSQEGTSWDAFKKRIRAFWYFLCFLVALFRIIQIDILSMSYLTNCIFIYIPWNITRQPMYVYSDICLFFLKLVKIRQRLTIESFNVRSRWLAAIFSYHVHISLSLFVMFLLMSLETYVKSKCTWICIKFFFPSTCQSLIRYLTPLPSHPKQNLFARVTLWQFQTEKCQFLKLPAQNLQF